MSDSGLLLINKYDGTIKSTHQNLPEIVDLGLFDSSKLWIKTKKKYLFKVDLFSDKIDLISTEGIIKYSTKNFLSIYTEYNNSLTQKITKSPFSDKFNLTFTDPKQIKYFDQYILVLYDSYLEIYNNDSGKKLIHASFEEPSFEFDKDIIFLVSNKNYKIFNNNIIYEFKK